MIKKELEKTLTFIGDIWIWAPSTRQQSQTSDNKENSETHYGL